MVNALAAALASVSRAGPSGLLLSSFRAPQQREGVSRLATAERVSRRRCAFRGNSTAIWADCEWESGACRSRRRGIFSRCSARNRCSERGFAPDEDVDGTGCGLPGRNAVAVIGYGLWQELFGGDPKVLGATIRIDGRPLTVIGVAPPGFDYPGKTVLWKPAAFSNGNNGWETIARLKPGITWTQARAAFAMKPSGAGPTGALFRNRVPTCGHHVAAGRTRWPGEETAL